MLLGSSLVLCEETTPEAAAMTADLNIRPEKPAGAVPFLNTMPQMEWQENSSGKFHEQRLDPSQLQQWNQQHPLRRLSPQAQAQRMNVRRREYASARGKRINRAFKHQERKHILGTVEREQVLDPSASTQPQIDLLETEYYNRRLEYSTARGEQSTRALKHHNKMQAIGAVEEELVLESVDSSSANQSQIELETEHYYSYPPKDKHVSTKSYKESKGKKSYKVNEPTETLHPVAGTYPPSDYHQATKISKSQKAGKDKGTVKKGPKGHHKSQKGGVRYFETNMLLEMESHYVAELSQTDIQHLEAIVLETYNQLSDENCDLQGRTLVAVTMDATPTSTGLILHLQGQCYNCDPSNVRVFAHPDEIFDSENMMMTMEDDMHSNNTLSPTAGGVEGNGTIGSNDTFLETSTPLTSVPGSGNATGASMGDLIEMMLGANAMTGTPVTGGNGTAPPTGENATARNRGVGPTHLLPKKIRTASKLRSRLQRSKDYDEEEERPPPFSYGTSAESRARYHQSEGQRRLEHHSAVNRDPEYLGEFGSQGGANINRGPVPITGEDRGEYVALDFSTGLVYPAQSAKKTGVKGLKSKETIPTSKGKGKGQGYHPVAGCANDEATLRAPTEEEFVTALNYATDSLFAQYNKFSVRSALQVRPITCDATEEEFSSSLVVVFMGSESLADTFSPAEINLAEETVLQTYNHLQATHSCDVPYFREMTEVVLKGFAPGADPDTTLAMFEVHGTCRGEECSNSATFFDPLDEDERQRHLMNHLQMSPTEFTPILPGSDQDIGYDEHSAHVYQEQCYCPLKIDEFGPPFVSDMEEVLNHAIQNAVVAGLFEAMVSVLDIMEVSRTDMEPPASGDVAYDNENRMTEDFESFVIVQFMGNRDAVIEEEVNAVEDSMPQVYNKLQESSFCDSTKRVLDSAVLQTVDPGPTSDTFLLGFFWMGTCEGDGCSGDPMFFAPPGSASISCGENKLEGPPVIEDFENNLFSSILLLRETGTLVNIQASGDAVEVLPGVPSASAIPSDTTSAPVLRTQTEANVKARNAAPMDGSVQPTSFPTWIDTMAPS
jgi:hypothetical protein